MAVQSSGNYVRRRARPESSKRARAREQEIIEAGVSIFAEKGYLEASTEDIGAAVGLLRGSLYYYIRSKEELLYRILVDTHEQYLAQTEAVRQLEGDALTRLRHLVRHHIVTFDVRRRKLFHAEFRHLNGARKREIIQMRSHYQEFVVSLIHEAQRDGTCDPNLSPDVVATLILHNINVLAGTEVDIGMGSLDEFADAVDTVLVKALAIPD